MRLVSWNIRKNPQAVEYAFDALGADVLLAQECNKRSQPGLESVGEFIDERWVRHKWGNMIFSKTRLSPLLLESEYKGSMTAASV